MILVPIIAQEMSVSLSAAQWTLTINLLVGAIATPVLGRMSDGHRQRAVLLWAMAFISLGSALCAVAPDFATFLVGRAMQGVSYGVMTVAITMARRHLPSPRLPKRLTGIAVSATVAAGVGYPVTGALTQAWGFRVPFVFAVVFGVSVMIVVGRIVPPDLRTLQREQRLDGAGVALLGGGLAALLAAVSLGPVWGWASVSVLSMFLGAAILLTAWVAVERRVPAPLVEVRLFRNAEVLVAGGCAIIFGSTMYALLSVLSLVAQAPAGTGYGLALPLVWAGFAMLPFALGSFVSSRVIGRVAHRPVGTLVLLIGAWVVVAAGVFLTLLHDTFWMVLGGLFVSGLGVGAVYSALPVMLARAVPAGEFGSVVGFNQVLRTVGGSVGSVVTGATITATMAMGGYPTAEGITLVLAISTIGSAVMAGVLLVRYLMARS